MNNNNNSSNKKILDFSKLHCKRKHDVTTIVGTFNTNDNVHTCRCMNINNNKQSSILDVHVNDCACNSNAKKQCASENNNKNNNIDTCINTVSIIGTAGRGDDAYKLSLEIFNKMMNKTIDIIVNEWNLNLANTRLVSGGAAYSDHLAVKIWRQYSDELSGITLYMPCKFDMDKKQFYTDGSYDWKKNPGNYCNYLHREFERKTGIKSLVELSELVQESKNETCSTRKIIIDYSCHGFHNRNTKVAKSKYIIAFTFSDNVDSNTPKPGGTADTLKKASETTIKKHVQIQYL